MLKKVLREPLLQFLVLGGAIFLAYTFWGNRDEAPDARTIVVDEPALIEFMQNRTRVFEPEAQRMRLESMSAQEIDALIEDYVREEVLFREAESLGLGEDDYIIKRRLVQKMEFIANAAAEQAAPLTEDEVAAYFEANRGDYAIPPYISFTHIFFDAELRGREAARMEATRASQTASETLPDGDRFPFAKNYVERTRAHIEDHFGDAMADALWQVEPGDDWHGPIESPYGYHLVRVYDRSDGRAPDLAEVRALAEADAAAARAQETVDDAASDITTQYDVRIEYAP